VNRADDALLARFVSGFHRFDESVVPPDAAVDQFDDKTLAVRARSLERPLAEYDWRPVRIDAAHSALEELRRRLPGPLPPLYERLITTYRFREVDLGEFRLLANLPDEAGSLAPLIEQMTVDPAFVAVLLPRGLTPFGKAWEGSYDPVCFDVGRRDAGGDCPVVRLDHEAILCSDKIEIVEELSPSFRGLVERIAQV
jgi:hypothetical protein